MIKHNDKLQHIATHVTISYDHESEAPNFDYGDAVENAKELARFQSGELLNVFIKVTASALGENGYDYLGQCFIRSSHIDDDIANIVAEHDMKNQACLELKNNVLLAYKTLKDALEGNAA
jgi:hypothetical protein